MHLISSRVKNRIEQLFLSCLICFWCDRDGSGLFSKAGSESVTFSESLSEFGCVPYSGQKWSECELGNFLLCGTKKEKLINFFRSGVSVPCELLLRAGWPGHHSLHHCLHCHQEGQQEGPAFKGGGFLCFSKSHLIWLEILTRLSNALQYSPIIR